MSFIVEMPYDESWPPSKLQVHIPREVSGIPDRPNEPLYEIKPVNIKSAIQTIINNSPKYEGEFEYEEV